MLRLPFFSFFFEFLWVLTVSLSPSWEKAWMIKWMGSVHKLESRLCFEQVFWDWKLTSSCCVGGLAEPFCMDGRTDGRTVRWGEAALLILRDSRLVNCPSVLLGLCSPPGGRKWKNHPLTSERSRRNRNTSFFFVTVLQVCHHPDKKDEDFADA